MPQDTWADKLRSAGKGSSLPAPVPQDEGPTDKPMSFGGFAENAIDDTAENVKGIALSILKAWPTAIKAGCDIFSDPQGIGLLAQHPEEAVKELKNTGGAIVDALTENYKKYGWKTPYYKPASTLLDILTVADLGGTAISKAGKLADIEKLVKLGEGLKAMPGKVALGTYDAAAGALGFDTKAIRAARQAQREAWGAKRANLAEAENAIYPKLNALSDEEAAMADRWKAQGVLPEEYAKHPKVADYYEAWKNHVDKEVEYLKGRGDLTDAGIEEATAKRYAQEVYGGTGEANVAKARADIKTLKAAGGKAPIYRPNLFDKKNVSLLDLMDAKGGKTGKPGFLHELEGAEGYSNNPREYVPRHLASYFEYKANREFLGKLLQDPKLAIGVAAKGSEAAGIMSADSPLTKFFNGDEQAKAVVIRDMVKEFGHDETARLMASGDSATLQKLDQASHVVWNPEIKRYLTLKYTRNAGPLGAFLRVYDKILGVFKKSATVINPRWYLGVTAGNAVASMLAGLTFGNMSRARRFMEMLPAEIRSIHGVDLISKDAGIFSKFGTGFQSFADYIHGLSDIVKGGIVDKEVVKSLSKAGQSFFADAAEAERAYKATLMAPRELSQIIETTQALEEQAARSVPTIQKFERQKAALTAKYDEEMAKFGGHRAGENGQSIATKLQQEIAVIDDTLGQLKADVRDKILQTGAMNERIPGLAAKAEVMRQGVARAHSFFHDFDGLGPVEQGLFRRLVPFYAWTKTITSLAFRLPFVAPKAGFLWNRYAAFQAKMTQDPELPDYMAGYFPAFSQQNGNTLWIRMSALSHFNSIGRSKVGEVPIPSLFAFWEQNPLISLGYHMAGGESIYKPDRVPFGEPVVANHDGSVYTLRDDGTIEKTLPQLPVVSGVAHMFPIVQYMENLLTPYQVAGHNFIGLPKPQYNPDGTIRYPREMMERLSSMLLPVMSKNREEIIRNEKIQTHGAIVDLKKLYKRSGPDDREYIKNALQDYGKGDYRKVHSR